MVSIFDEISLSAVWVRRLGLMVLVVGLLLPISAVVYHATSWEPPDEVERIGPLRPELVILPAGTFLMGSPEDEPGLEDDGTLHEVLLTRRFAISRTEITQQQFLAVLGERPSEGIDEIGNSCAEAGVGEDLPVVCVSWLKALRFCNRLSEMEGLEPVYTIEGQDVTWDETALGYRLPTEAEWEYAARAGTRHRYAGTDDESEACEFANVSDSSFGCDDGFEALAPVASKRPNRWQLYDMTGNAWEWVWDGYGAYPSGNVEDPRGDDAASDRVVRGGSWWNIPRHAQVTVRYKDEPSISSRNLGFRVARTLPSAP